MPLSARMSRTTAIVLSLALMAGWIGSVGVAFFAYDEAVEKEFGISQASQQVLVSMLDQETALRGFLATDDDDFFLPYDRGRGRLAEASVRLDRAIGDDERLRPGFRDLLNAARNWQAAASEDVGDRRASPRLDRDDVDERRRLMNEFREENRQFNDRVDAVRRGDLDRYRFRAIASILGIGLLVAASGAWLLRRSAKREVLFQRSQQEFAHAIQSAEDEAEAHRLLKRHLERTLAGATVHILARTPEDDRLLPATPLPAGTPLEPLLADAGPRDCLAVRRAARYERSTEAEPLVQCGICGVTERSVCQPLLVGDRVIGSVLVEGAGDPNRDDRRAISETVAHAAPVLHSLRTRAVAEAQAVTDVLTGLPNRRAMQDGVKRMLAQAARIESPLAVLVVDLDHFKAINDTHGHEAGDEVLAAVGRTLADGLRVSDFAARSGGEEFAVLLPDTGLDGALTAAESLRRRIASTVVPGTGVQLSASIGVAVYPDDASDADGLLREGDRAMYAAKRMGRDRVVSAAEARRHPPPAGDVGDAAAPAAGGRGDDGPTAPSAGRRGDGPTAPSADPTHDGGNGSAAEPQVSDPRAPRQPPAPAPSARRGP